MVSVLSVKQCLNQPLDSEQRITVRGWVKTRRDSNAGLSFISLHDGSCFAALQLVAANTLDNYSSECLKLTPGCSITATGY